LKALVVDAEDRGGVLLGVAEDGVQHERHALARRQAVHDRGHAALLELPQVEVALRLDSDVTTSVRVGSLRKLVVEQVEGHVGPLSIFFSRTWCAMRRSQGSILGSAAS